jgi:long-chain fatty acid transport protein
MPNPALVASRVVTAFGIARTGRSSIQQTSTLGPLRRLLATALVLLPALGHATNGYFSHGYGMRAQGMGGVGYALPQDAFASAYNPAGMADVDNRLDLGVSWFIPRRSADIVGNAFGPDQRFDGDGRKNFFIPEVGYVRRLSPRLSAGLALYGNGGLNTEFDDNPFARFGGSGEAGVNLEQLFITPSLSYRLSEHHAIGVAANVAYQRFYARGLGVFSAFSLAPDKVSNNGTDDSIGVGIRLGWLGTLAPGLTVGASWASKIDGRFDRYRGLFADGGGFDVPENYGVGIAWQGERWTVAADVQRVLYSEVGSVGNPVAALFAGVPLGADNGPGFGWRDVTTYKLGFALRATSRLTLRAGVSHLNQPIPDGETFFNILAPGVVEDHLSLGATWQLANGAELSGFFTHAFGKTVRGSNSIPAGFPPVGLGGGNADIRLKETMLGLSYAWRLR